MCSASLAVEAYGGIAEVDLHFFEDFADVVYVIGFRAYVFYCLCELARDIPVGGERGCAAEV